MKGENAFRMPASTHSAVFLVLQKIMYTVLFNPRPGGVEVRIPPLGGKNEGSIPVVLGFFLHCV